jgi:putative transposase
MSTYRFIAAERESFGVRMCCRHLGVSPSAFYDWQRRPPSRREVDNRALAKRIGEIHESSRGTYGAPRITAELRADGVRICRKRVARLMRLERLQGVHIRRRRWRKGTGELAPAPDRVARAFRTGEPDRVWVADITYVATEEGWLHLAAIEDLFSRRIVGWAMAPHLRTELVVDALEMAISNRRPARGLVHHSDQGTQFTSFAFGRRLREAGILPSMGAVGTAYDNAVVESFFSTLKRELVHRERFATRAEARSAIFEFIEVFYNRQRRHSTIGMVSPTAFERDYARALTS